MLQQGQPSQPYILGSYDVTRIDYLANLASYTFSLEKIVRIIGVQGVPPPPPPPCNKCLAELRKALQVLP